MSKIKRKNYSSLSSTEFEIAEFVIENELKVFRVKDIQKGLSHPKNKVYRQLSKLKNKELVESPMRGRYILNLPNYSVSNFEAASHIYWPSYISFWTALSYHNLTDQLPHTIYVVNTETSKEIEFRNHKIQFINLKPQIMFGYANYDGIIAEPEKAVIDSLHLPKYAGGIKEIVKALDRELDIQKLEYYAEKTGLSSVKKRLKYLLDRKNIKNDIEVEGGYVKLDPTNESGEYVTESLVEDNVYNEVEEH